jgi:hypothetical protein
VALSDGLTITSAPSISLAAQQRARFIAADRHQDR